MSEATTNGMSRREELLAVATKLFAARGYHGTRMDDVADAVGLNKATVYHYYASKSLILYDIYKGAADFTVDALAAILAGRRTQIKGVLRDQHIIAGIGNAYSDEILHAARMSPFKPAAALLEGEDDTELVILYDAIRVTLGDAVERSRGLAMSELKGEKKSNMAVHGRTGQACPVCGDTVREVSFADSSLQYCPTCQTGGKPLADRRMSKLLK